MFEIGYVYGIKLNNGVEVLIYIGIDIVLMGGKGFI